jgi:dTDP-4-dehydrorhamnose 3,5-epimerase
MKFEPTPINGAYLITPSLWIDERGAFARLVCEPTWVAQGLKAHFCQQSFSWNPRKGTVRGLHLQLAPHQEEKLVRVTRGRIFDVLLDLRPHSPSFCRWWSVELSADNRMQLYIPKGVAHGFQTLENGSEVFYQMTEPYVPEAARGVHWQDPQLNIQWPPSAEPLLVGEKDQQLPSLSQFLSAHEL